MQKVFKEINRPVGQAVRRSSLKRWSEVQILGRSNRTQCCQRFATAARFLRKELCGLQVQERGDGPCKLVTRFGVLQRD